MPISKVATLVAASLLWALGGCGASERQPDEKANSAAAEKAAPDTASTGDIHWNALDACSLIDKSFVAKAAGSEVTETRLTRIVKKAGHASASTCIFTLANESSVTVLTRQSPLPDYSDYAVEQARTLEGRIAPSEDVKGIGRAALWSDELDTLQVFIDDTRYLTISIMNPQDSDTRRIAMAIGAKLAA